MSYINRIIYGTRNVPKERKIKCDMENCTALAEVEYIVALVGHTFWCKKHGISSQKK